MRPRLTSIFLAIVLVSSGFAQEQQPSKDQAPPDSNAPQAGAPPNSNPQTPPGNDAQNAAPPKNEPEQAAPKAAEPAPSNQNAPTAQEKAPPQQQPPPPEQPAVEPKAPAKPKVTSRKITQSRKRKATSSAKSKSAHRPKATTPSSGEAEKVVVRNGGATDDVIHLSPGGTQEQNAHNRENTAQLLATTDENLKRLSGRQLSPAQQSTVDQIHSYVRQARSAADSGDLARAHTLAFKAHLLSDDLAQH